MNYARTALLLAGLTALFLGAGFLLGGQGGMMIALLFAVGMNLFAYWNADRMVLRMYGAREVDARTAPDFVAIIKQLADNAGLPMPRVYVIDSDQPNAFATGRNPDNAAVAATTGLLHRLSNEEVAGVMAHELAHVRNRDTLIMTITATIAGALSMLANFALFFGGSRNNPLGFIGTLLVMILAPIAAMLVQMAISRTREYEADRIGAEICGRPLWLASALEKLERGAQAIDNDQAEANPATAHLFIVNPLHARGVDGLFSTHPSTANRVQRLRDMAGLVVIDFIDMEYGSNVRKVEKAMKEALKNDRARIQVGRISGFGLMEMSRQRLRTGVLEATTRSCPHCDGTGLVRTASSAGLSALRLIEDEAAKGKGSVITLYASNEAAIYLLNAKRADLAEIEERYGVSVEVVPEGEEEGAKMRVTSSGPRPTSTPKFEAIVDDEEEEPEVDEAEDDNDDEEGRPKKRRRRRRGGRGRNKQRQDSEDQSDEEEDSDESPDDNSSDGDDESSEDRTKKRRRRRGGRGRNRRRDESAGDESSGEENGDEAKTSDKSAPAESSEPIAEEAPVAEEKPKPKRTRRKKAEPAAKETAEAEASPEPEAEAKPKPKRTRKKKADTEAEAKADAPAAEPEAEEKPKPKRTRKKKTDAETEAPAKEESAPEPAPAAANDANGDKEVAAEEGTPRRGWWQRTFGE